MKINIHAGHNPDGKIACGAVGLISESTAAREVVNKLIPLLQKAGHTVYNCTVDNGTSQSDVLARIIRKCNSNDVDLDISIHFNSSAKDLRGDGETTGTEVFVYNKITKAYEYAEKVCAEISKLGYKNRGVKVSKDLYYLNSTKAPALLIECCFVDDLDDVKLYTAENMAKAIANAICGDPSIVEQSKIIVDGIEKPVRRILHEGTNYIAIRDIASAFGYNIGNDGNVPVLYLSWSVKS